MLFRILTTGSAALVLAVGVGRHSAAAQGAADDPGVKTAHTIQDRVIALHAHDTSSSSLGSSENDTEEFDRHVDQPKMRAGWFDAALIFNVLQSRPKTTSDTVRTASSERAYEAVLTKFDAMHRFTDVIPRNQMEPARSSADVWRLNMDAKGKRGALAKIWSDNSLRVMDDVQKIATKLQKRGMLANDQAGPITAAVDRSAKLLDAQPRPQPKPMPGTFWLALGLALIAVVVMLA